MSDGNETENSNESETNEETSTTETTETNSEETEQKETSLVEKSETEDEEKTSTEEEPTPLTAEDIEFPEGVEVNEELRDKFLTVMNDKEMSPKELAQALTNLQVEAAKEMAETSNRAFDDMQKKWQDEVKADPELGGSKLQDTLGGISRLVDRYGSDDLVQVMAATGAGNNVHVIRFLNKIAADLNEGTPATGTATVEKPNVASRLFPSMKG